MFTREIKKNGLGTRAMTEEEMQEFLTRIRYGTVSYITKEGWPDSRVLNFAYSNSAFYFHARKNGGEKQEHWEEGTRMCISFFAPSPNVGKMRRCMHESILAYGTLHRIDIPEDFKNCPEEAYHALEALSFSGGTPFKALPENLMKSAGSPSVYRVDPEYISGKYTFFNSLPEESYYERVLMGKDRA